MKLSAVRLFVRELAPARAFYADLLRLRMTQGGVQLGYYAFESGGVHVVVELVAANAPAEDQVLVGRFTGVSFAVSDINAEYARLSAHGVHFSGPPERQSWGGWLATFRDPSGNELQLAQYSG
jgi:predicted enzyme related to lactoylglutathione lyase